MKEENPKNMQDGEKTSLNRKSHSFKQVPTYTRFIDRIRNAKENSLDKKDDLIKKLPKTLRYLKPSPMQTFYALFAVSGYFTFKALQCIIIMFSLNNTI